MRSRHYCEMSIIPVVVAGDGCILAASRPIEMGATVTVEDFKVGNALEDEPFNVTFD